MTPEQFVEVIREGAYESAVEGTRLNLIDPPGRRPSEVLLRLSEWYSGLAAGDREMVHAAAREGAHAAIFAFFAILDGVQAIEGPGPKGALRLTYVSASGEETLLTGSGEDLHDLFNAGALPQ